MASDSNPRHAQYSSKKMLPEPDEVGHAGWAQQISENVGALARHAYLERELAWQLPYPAGGFGRYNDLARGNIRADAISYELSTAPKGALVFGAPSLQPRTSSEDHVNYHIMEDIGQWQEGRYSDASGWWGEWALPIRLQVPYGKPFLTGLMKFVLIGVEALDNIGTHTDGRGTLSIYPFVKSTLTGLDERGSSASRDEWGRKLIEGTAFGNGKLEQAVGTTEDAGSGVYHNLELGMAPTDVPVGSYIDAYVGFCYTFGFGTRNSGLLNPTLGQMRIEEISVYNVGTNPPGE